MDFIPRCQQLVWLGNATISPNRGFEWVDVTQRENWGDFILQQHDEQDDGYMLEVDLEYPEELHDIHDNFPCAPEKIVIKKNYLSDTQKMMGEQTGERYKSEKLCLTLDTKVKYKLHYRNLKQYMQLGLKLTKVHRVLKFKQSPWLKPYIELNTKLRQEETNPFEVSLYKFMNNSFFGKNCKDVRKYNEVMIVMDEEKN